MAARCSDSMLSRASSTPVSSSLEAFLKEPDRFRDKFGDQVGRRGAGAQGTGLLLAMLACAVCVYAAKHPACPSPLSGLCVLPC